MGALKTEAKINTRTAKFTESVESKPAARGNELAKLQRADNSMIVEGVKKVFAKVLEGSNIEIKDERSERFNRDRISMYFIDPNIEGKWLRFVELYPGGREGAKEHYNVFIDIENLSIRLRSLSGSGKNIPYTRGWKIMRDITDELEETFKSNGAKASIYEFPSRKIPKYMTGF